MDCLPVGALLHGHTRAVAACDQAPFGPAGKAASAGAVDMAVSSTVTAHDRPSPVILGDPAVRFPATRNPGAVVRRIFSYSE